MTKKKMGESLVDLVGSIITDVTATLNPSEVEAGSSGESQQLPIEAAAPQLSTLSNRALSLAQQIKKHKGYIAVSATGSRKTGGLGLIIYGVTRSATPSLAIDDAVAVAYEKLPRNKMISIPATMRLIVRVETSGGDGVSWEVVNGIADLAANPK